MVSQNIYCDESGFTGNKLLDRDQLFFSYATVAINPQEAKEIVEDIIKKYKIQGGEIKGKNLLKREKGKKALDEILTRLRGKYKVSVSNKQYALAAKFFEYIFEPSLAKVNSIFYYIDFHRFISNYLYMEMKIRTPDTMVEEIFEDFESLMRTGNVNDLKTLFSKENISSSPVLKDILDFALYQREVTLDELDGYIGVGSGKWSLDLTTTALFSSLAAWGEEFEELEVYCDSSKPLNDNQEIFTSMVGRKDKIYSTLAADDKYPISFNLSKLIQQVDSLTTHGIQLADAIAAIYSYAGNPENNGDSYAKKWLKTVEYDPKIIVGSVVPDLNYVDLESPNVRRNWLLLKLLVEKIKNNIPLLEDIENDLNDLTLFIVSESFPSIET